MISQQDALISCATLLTELPREIIYQVVFFLSNGIINRNGTKSETTVRYPENGFVLNHIYCGNNEVYQNIINLSSTCISFRKLLAGIIFRQVSLVRTNQIDCLFNNPSSLCQFSDSKSCTRQFLKEILFSNFASCNYAEQAKYSFKLLHKLSNYQTNFSCNHFITYLECDNSLLVHDLSFFTNLAQLKILDQPSLIEINGTNFPANLKFLSINLITLIHISNLNLSSLERIDILEDFQNLVDVDYDKIVQFMKTVSFTNIVQFNLFVNRSYVINYQILIDWLQVLTENCHKLSSLNIRLIKSKITQNHSNNNWKIYSCGKYGYFSGHYTGLKFAELLTNIETIGIDLKILQELLFPVHANVPSTLSSVVPKKLILIEPYMAIPKIPQDLKQILRQLIHLWNVQSIQFKFGEVIDQSDIQALNLMTNFISYISNEDMKYHKVKQISLEKCWSVTDEMTIREYYNSLLMNYSANKLKIDSAMVWKKVSFNSPRYRIEDCFEIQYTEYNENLPPSEVTLIDYYNILDHQIHHRDDQQQNDITLVSFKPITSRVDYEFWSVESSKVELEQYTLKQRKLSSIWD